MAMWRGARHKKKSGLVTTLGAGENTSRTAFEISKSESSYSRNISSRNYPALSVRPGRVNAFTSITTPNALSNRNNEYPHILDGTTWKRWDGNAWQNVQAGMADAPAKFLEFNTEAARYTICVDGTNKKSWNGTTVANITGGPATTLYTVDDYRLYALLGSVLKCSAEGSITDWTTANDADSIPLTGMIGTETAITSYKDTVICWSEHTMHVLYGNDPYDFYLSDLVEVGCISDRSVINHNGILYWLDFGKYMKFTGGKPQEIGQKVKEYLENINTTYKTKCVSGKHGKYIYLSIPYGPTATENNITLEYDTELDKWFVSNSGYVDFTNIGEFFYGVDSSGQLYKINSGTDDNGTPISWEYITGVWMAGALSQKKTISDYWIVFDLPAASSLILSYSKTINADDFIVLKTFTGSNTEQNLRVQVSTRELVNIDWYRLKFSGVGPCSIYYLEEQLKIKAR